MSKLITPNQVLGEIGEAAVRLRFLTIGFQFDARSRLESGIDGIAEVMDKGRPLARMIAVQVKTTEASKYTSEDENGFSYLLRSEDLTYWKGSNLPIILVLYRRSDETFYWQEVQGGIGTGERRLIFNKQKDVLDSQAVDRLAALTVPKAGFGYYVPPLGGGEEALVNILPVTLPNEIFVSSKLDTLSAQQELIEHEQELRVQQGRLTEATAGIAALKEQRQQAEAEFRHKALDDLAQDQQKAASLREQLVQAQQKYRLQTLTAPVDGTVQQLAVHTEGGVVTPAQALLAIVPADSKLEIEAMVPNRDIGFIHEGQEAEIKIDTFNFTKYGFIQGKVLSLSQDAITRERPTTPADNSHTSGASNESSEPKGQELVYTARVSLEKTQMQVDDRLVSLSPGMAVTVEIKTGKRRVIEYILSPIFRHKQEALRER